MTSDLRKNLIEAIGVSQGWEESAVAMVDDVIMPIIRQHQAEAVDVEGLARYFEIENICYNEDADRAAKVAIDYLRPHLTQSAPVSEPAALNKALEKEEQAHEQTVSQRDAAQDAADEMASLILGEAIDWAFHDEKWQQAIEKFTQSVKPVSEWQPIETAPVDGTPFYARQAVPMRWKPYKPQARQQGYPDGRWQEMNEYGGWKNTEREPYEWQSKEIFDSQCAPVNVPVEGE